MYNANTEDLRSRIVALEWSLLKLERRVDEILGERGGTASALPARPDEEAVSILCPSCGSMTRAGRERCFWCGWAIAETTPAVERPAYAIANNVAPQAVAPQVAFVEHDTSQELPDVPRAPETEQERVFQMPTWRPNFDVVTSADFWLNKVGIALFLFGIAFLFKYTVDQGWLTEQIRVGAGVVAGTVLVGFGVGLHGRRRHFSQVLMGGGIATYYITGYAAYALFPNLGVPYPLALGFMVGVTFLAFTLSVRQDEITLSVIGLAGGMLTPFVLDSAIVKLPGLVGYTCLILAWVSGVYLIKGWRSLLLTGTQIVGTVLFAGFIDRAVRGTLTLDDRWALQGGAIFALAAFWAVPLLREVLHRRDPQRWPFPRVAFMDEDDARQLLDMFIYPLAAGVPLSVFAFSWVMWGDWVSREVWGFVALGAAGLLGLSGWLLRRPDVKLAYLHAMLAVAGVTTCVVSLLRGDALLFALAAEGLALYAVSRRFYDVGTEVWGHVLFGAAGGWLAARLLAPAEFPLLVNPAALTDLAVIAVVIGASFVIARREATLALRGFAHVALLAWAWREVSTFPEGPGYVALIWAAYAVALHLASRWMPDRANSLSTQIAAHLAFGAALEVLATRLVGPHGGEGPLANARAIIDMGVIAVALAASFAARPVERMGPINMQVIYRLFVHAAALGWLVREATPADIDSGTVMLRWAVYLTTVALISHRVGDRATPLFLHYPWLVVCGWYWVMLWQAPRGEFAFVNPSAAIALLVIACAFASSLATQPRRWAALYRLMGHVGVLLLLLRELWPHSSYTAVDLVVLSWAIYILGMQLLARRMGDRLNSGAAHVAYLGVALMLMLRGLLGDVIFGTAALYAPHVPFFNRETLVDVTLIAITMAISAVLWYQVAPTLYRLFAHGAVIGVLWRELYGLEHGDSYLLFAVAAYATLLHIVASRTRHTETRVIGHALFGVAGVVLLARFITNLLITNPDAFAVLNPRGLAEGGVVLLGVAVYVLAGYPRVLSATYAWWLHFAFLGWTWQELGLIPNNDGNGYVSIAWGVYGIALTVAGLKLGMSRPLIGAGLTTLLAVAAKLFLIDLSYVGVLWRIFLFLGFGAAFLLFSYYLSGAMRRSGSDHQDTKNTRDALSF